MISCMFVVNRKKNNSIFIAICGNLHVLGYEVDGNGILGPARNNHVRVFFGRQAELFKSWLHQACVLVKNIFEIPSPVPDVPHHPPGKSCVCISVNKEFEMEEVPQPREVEDEDALDQDHVRAVDG